MNTNCTTSATTHNEPSLMGRTLHPLKDAARRLGMTVWGLRAWVYAGRIASHKIGSKVCISEDEIERIIAESERPASVAYKRVRSGK
jgi:excisionase family DNA binding protein